MRPLSRAASALVAASLSVILAVPAVAQTTTAETTGTSAATPGAIKQEERRAWDTPGTTAHLSHVAHAVGADQAWANRYTGQGVGIALIDTGVAPVAGLADVVQGPDLSLDAPWASARHVDAYGHGTHLAGIITSDRTDARGIAPDARLVSLKVGAHNGSVDVSQVIAAIDWVVQHRAQHAIRVLVLPYGTDSLQPSTADPLAHAVETAWRNGIVVVASAGNDGEAQPWVSNPARDPYVIAVAATDTLGSNGLSDDVRPAWSAPGDDSRRPDVSAPGTGIVSAAVPGGHLTQTYPAAARPGGLFRGSGTSQAAAVTGAAVALLLQARPDLSPDQVKALLRATAKPLTGQTAASGAGTIAIQDAIKAPVPAGATQAHPRSTGTGHLELSRGTHHLMSSAGDRLLVGEVDVHGRPFDAGAWAAAATAGTSWQAGVWNGTAWTGTGWTTTASGQQAWQGISWDGISWDGISWAGISWAGISWDGISWAGISWDGISWAGISWAAGGFDGISWDGISWDGTTWDGISWAGISWAGISWAGISWAGVSWDGISWASVRWD